jgi:hypothetical protein
MNTYTNIVLSAGSAVRYSGFHKEQLTDETGMTLKERLKKQFPDAFYFDEKQCPKTCCACDTFIQTAPLWGERVTILLSDVFYTDATANRIRLCMLPVAFFSDTQDIFAISFDAHIGMAILLPAAKRVLDEGGHNKGRLWEMYRKMLFINHTVKVPPPNNPFLEIVSDETQDFDSPDEYYRWRSGQTKNVLYQPKGKP